MKIIVAGAGAGKTTSMSKHVLDRLSSVSDGKIIYVITYTNAARNKIREKIIDLYGSKPRGLYIETLHAFLLREIIFPFNHLIYGQNYTRVSQMQLPDNMLFRSKKLKELTEDKIIHVDRVTEIAKWVICKKTGDSREIKEKRVKILATISRYLDSVYIDEAQDMDKHFSEIIEVLRANEIKILLVGDPKQDLRGRNAYFDLINKYKDRVEYLKENYRCPVSHVRLANSYVSQEELQEPQTDVVGTLHFVLESSVDISPFVYNTDWSLVYICKKNGRFLTHERDNEKAYQYLTYEIRQLIVRSEKYIGKTDPGVYEITKIILLVINKDNDSVIFKKIESLLSIKLSRQDMGKIGNALRICRECNSYKGITINSVDSIKGLEGEKCLFVLTTDLSEYLFREKNDHNKMLNYLYVALTRAKQELMFLVTVEVEKKYGLEYINKKFSELNITKKEIIS